MSIHTGKSADGSDAQAFEGLEANPYNTEEWISNPYRGQQRDLNMSNELFTYMAGKYTLDDVYSQIVAKTCPLSRRCRDYVLDHYDENGKFIKR